ncbi:MAG: phosphoglucomutase/phosphomannomutase family protein [Bacteroidota bacterium]|jgi:phosphomannomutase
MAVKIKFGTDGWRAIIAEDFTVDNVRRVAYATAEWLLQKKSNPVLVLGHDCRFAGELFCENIAQVCCERGVRVIMADNVFVSTPMISLAATKLNADLGVIITASHNPPGYNGYKLKGSHGGPSSPKDIQEVEDLIPDTVSLQTKKTEYYEKAGLLEYVDMESMYIDHVRENFDLDAINNSDITVAYDAMYGAGQRVIPQLLKNAILLHCDHNPSFMGQAPEPILRNLQELQSTIRNAERNVCGLATDGDADRIGMFDEDGNFIDAHHIILLLIHYLHHYRKMDGKVVIAFSVSEKIKRLCEHYNLPYEVTKIGFKYISEKMIIEDVLVGGEESGGIAVKGHIPERDGIWDGLVLLEFMAKTGKNMKEIIEEVYRIVGPFTYDRNDLHLEEAQKLEIIDRCRTRAYTQFGEYSVQRTEDIDGYKYHFKNGEWLMIRASGTEPLLRVYAEAPSRNEVNHLLHCARKTLLG